MDGCEYSIETIIVPLKERIAETFFWEITILLPRELLKQRMTASSLVKINTAHFKECMTSILSVTNTDALLQGMDGFN